MRLKSIETLDIQKVQYIVVTTLQSGKVQHPMIGLQLENPSLNS